MAVVYAKSFWCDAAYLALAVYCLHHRVELRRFKAIFSLSITASPLSMRSLTEEHVVFI